MRTDELVTAVRLAGKLSPFDLDYTSAAILTEAWNVLMSAFVKPVVESRQAYWLKTEKQANVAGKARYRIPSRAVVGALEKVELIDSVGDVRRLVQASSQDAPAYENRTGVPYRYVVQDDQVVLMPTPQDATYTLRQSYYLRPSQLCTFQTAGLITAVDTTARTVTVAAKPTDASTAAAITNATLVDIVHPNGSLGLSLVNAAQTVSGAGPYVYTIAGTLDMSEIEVGDYLRAAQQTDWPCLPLEFHSTLAEATAVMILTKKGDLQKASALTGKVQNDVDRFLALACPRVKQAPPIIRQRYGIIRGRGASRFPVAQ